MFCICLWFLPPAYVVRREVMFSLCPPFRGGGTYLPDGEGGGTYSQVWMVGRVPTFPGLGGYLPSGWVGVPTFPGLGAGGTYLLGGGGGGVPTLRSGWGVPT